MESAEGKTKDFWLLGFLYESRHKSALSFRHKIPWFGSSIGLNEKLTKTLISLNFPLINWKSYSDSMCNNLWVTWCQLKASAWILKITFKGVFSTLGYRIDYSMNIFQEFNFYLKRIWFLKLTSLSNSCSFWKSRIWKKKWKRILKEKCLTFIISHFHAPNNAIYDLTF